MKNRILLLAATLAAGLTSACTINTSDLEEALKLPEVTPEVKASFESAVSTVTEQVLDAAMEAAEGATTAAAPAFSKQALRRLADTAQAGETVNVNASKSTEDGGTITVTGTITASGTDESGNVNLDLKADWANLTVNDGKATQKTTGNETITGTMSWTTDTFAVNLVLKGSFTLGSESYAFNINMTMDGDKMVYTGTVNGQTVNGNVAAETPQKAGMSCMVTASGGVCDSPMGGPETCTEYQYDYCIAFTDTAWTSSEVSSLCGPSPITPACPTSGLLGTCTQMKNGKEYAKYVYSENDTTQSECIADGGTWVGNR